MLLGGFRVVVGAAMLALVSCATYVNTQLGRSLIDKNYWLYIIDSDAVNFYYAPSRFSERYLKWDEHHLCRPHLTIVHEHLRS